MDSAIASGFGAHPVPRFMLSYDTAYTSLGNGSIIINEDECFCMDWMKSMGTSSEKLAANILQWIAFGFSILILMFYAYHTWRATCGWEEVYVCTVELIKVIIEFYHEFDTPAMLYLSTGERVLWIRYGEWLLTCPVILIHLSNLTGLADDYNKRTMRLLVSDIGTIVFGCTSAMSTGWLKILFFLLGCLYGSNTFFHAAKVYIESYHMVPKGHCRVIVRLMAWAFFVSWAMFPILFVLGPEGFGHISVYASTIGHTIIDLLSKNCWGLLGHHLRVKIHEHILIHGDIRKTTKVNIAGVEMEVETLVEAEDEDTVKKPTADYAKRESFLIMRDRLKDKGFEVRASLDADTADGAQGAGNNAHNKGGKGTGSGMMEMGKYGSGKGPAAIENGRVILAVPDISMVDFFREQFSAMPAHMELVPALGVDNTVALVQQAMNLGGCDFVLMHPEFLRERGPTSLLAKLKMLNQRTAAFGWASVGPMRDLIEGSGVDGYLEGPSFGAGISQQALVQLIANMQQAKRQATMQMMNMGLGGMGGSGMMGSPSMMHGSPSMMHGGNSMVSQGSGMPGMLQQQNSGMLMGGGQAMMQPQGSMGGAAMGAGMMGMQGNSARMGTNPLFGSAPSPLSSQPGAGMAGGGMSMGSGTGMAGGMTTPPAAPPAGNAASEAEMLQQLMAEINRLKSELGEQAQ